MRRETGGCSRSFWWSRDLEHLWSFWCARIIGLRRDNCYVFTHASQREVELRMPTHTYPVAHQALPRYSECIAANGVCVRHLKLAHLSTVAPIHMHLPIQVHQWSASTPQRELLRNRVSAGHRKSQRV